MKKSDAHILGIDIGGTHITAVLWNGKKILRKKIVNMPPTKKQFIKALNKLIKMFGRDRTIRIGISVAGIINGNTIIRSPNISYLKNFSFSHIFDRTLFIKVDNDARSFLRCECLVGNARGSRKTIGLTIGTGIGRAFAVRGRVKKIKLFEYPEKWEKEYQHIRKTRDNLLLYNYLEKKLVSVIKRYNPDTIVAGGGVILGRKQKITRPLFGKIKRDFPKIKIITPRFGAYSGAIGGALLFK